MSVYHNIEQCLREVEVRFSRGIVGKGVVRCPAIMPC